MPLIDYDKAVKALVDRADFVSYKEQEPSSFTLGQREGLSLAIDVLTQMLYDPHRDKSNSDAALDRMRNAFEILGLKT